MIRTLLLTFVVSLATTVFTVEPSRAATKAGVEAQFRQWLENDLWPEASREGVSKPVFDRAFSGVSLDWDLPDLAPPGFPKPKKRAQSQAEFRSPGAYFSEKRLQGLTASGRALMKKHAGLLRRIEDRYGVPGSIIVAIWGRESGFGRAKIPHSAVRVIATKAFMSTRTELFRKEILAALKILQRGDIPASAMKGSWAGAMGQPQFLPSSYLDHAVDFDGDGKRDIWNSTADSLASIANYLAQSGWVRGRDWGFEAVIP